jgi:hypothetical protein
VHAWWFGMEELGHHVVQTEAAVPDCHCSCFTPNQRQGFVSFESSIVREMYFDKVANVTVPEIVVHVSHL